MSVMQELDFDLWRQRYDEMSFAEHQAFNAECLALYPDQRAWNAQAVSEFLAERKPERVIELGGWDGALAARLLPDLPLTDWWVNYDITPGVPQVCEDPRYEVFVLEDWPWNREVKGDVLIASHVFEHMRITEVEKLVERWDVDSIYVDCPIGWAAQSWWSYHGSHILEVGATDLCKRFANLGYDVTRVFSDQFIAYFDRR